MNPYESIDPRPNTVILEESSEVLHDGLVQETVEGEDGEKITITTMEVPTEEKTSVANRDFSEDLKLYMAKYPAYQHMLGMEVPMRSYMWSFFSGIVNMDICENKKNQAIHKEAFDDVFSAPDLLELAQDFVGCALANKKNVAADSILLAAEYLAWAYLNLMGYANKFVVPTPPEEKDVVEEIVEKELSE